MNKNEFRLKNLSVVAAFPGNNCEPFPGFPVCPVIFYERWLEEPQRSPYKI